MSRSILYIAIFIAFFIISSTVCPVYTQELSAEDLHKPEITKKIFDNGLTVLIKEDRDLPIVSIEARFKVGSAREAEFLGCGISHFVEHMLFKGTPTTGPGEIEREIKSYGGTISGFTSFDSTGYGLTVESKYFKEALALLADAIMNPAFLEEEVEKERNVILKEIKLRKDDPARRAFELLWFNAYITHPYRYPVIGYEELFKQINRQDLTSFHKKHYIPNNLVLGICGDVDKDTVLEQVEEAFKDYKRQRYKIESLPEEPRQITERKYSERTNVKLSRLLISYHSIPIWHQDLFALDVLASALGEGESSVLHKRLVEEEKIAYAVAVYNYTPKEPGIFFISVLLDEENIPEAVKAIDDEVSAIKKAKIDRAQLTKAKNRTLSSFILSHETTEAQARDLAEGEILVGDPNFSSHYVKGVEDVNTEDVVRVANLYLKDNGKTVVSLLPEFTKEEALKSELVKSEIEINKFVLPNSMRIIIREDHTLPIVTMRAVLKGGTRLEDIDNNGLSNITAQMLLSGTKRRSKEKIYKSIEERGGDIASFSGNNSFGISLTVLSKDLDFGLELLSDILQSPDFPNGELAKLKELVLAGIKNREDDIFESGMKLFRENLFKNHPYRFTILGEKDSVEKVERKDIVEFYKQFVVPPNTVLAIFGDVNTKETLKKVDKLFKNFQGEIPKRFLEEAPKLEAVVYTDKKFMDKEQTLIIAGLKTIKIIDPDIYAFSVLSSILSGTDGRLFYEVRDKLGVSYAQGVSSVPGIDPGYFLFYIATSREHLRLGKQLIADEIKKLQADSVTDEELKLAKIDVIASQLRRSQSNSSLAFETSLDELYGLGYDNFKKINVNIEAVTKEDIDRIINKYFILENLTVVTLGPLQSVQ